MTDEWQPAIVKTPEQVKEACAICNHYEVGVETLSGVRLRVREIPDRDSWNGKGGERACIVEIHPEDVRAFILPLFSGQDFERAAICRNCILTD